jgi:hypothetical protein
LAYFFEFDFLDARDPNSYLGPVRSGVALWKSGRNLGMLVRLDDGNSLVIRDGRSTALRNDNTLRGKASDERKRTAVLSLPH